VLVLIAAAHGSLFSRFKGHCHEKKILMQKTEETGEYRDRESGLAGPEPGGQRGPCPIHLLEGLPLPSQVPCGPDPRHQVSWDWSQQG
jgi:hypothetical protein